MITRFERVVVPVFDRLPLTVTLEKPWFVAPELTLTAAAPENRLIWL